MSAINGVTNPYADLGLAVQQGAAKQALGQEQFLRLMTTQLQHQDPFKPMESGEFLSQIAQFSTVSGIQDLQASFSSLASSMVSNQTLQAAGLIGREVMVQSEVGFLPEDGTLQGAAYVPSGGQVQVDIVDASGTVVRSLDLGTQPAGAARFDWDGLDSRGLRMEEGSYTLQARLQQGETQQSLQTFAVAQVKSVALGSSGIALELRGLAATALNDVYQIL
jgi:flagellar basal-body rod modification protein FlgD